MAKYEFNLFTPEEKEKPPVISYYKAVEASNYGVNVDKQAVFGLTLIPVEGQYGYDPLHENIMNIGNEAEITYPDEGLEKDAIYLVTEQCSSYEWESGLCDDTELFITKVDNYDTTNKTVKPSV